MGAHGIGFAAWFFPTYIGFFLLVAVAAVVLLVAVFRRPLERFPGSWPAPRLRWGAVPAIEMTLLLMQAALIGLALVPGKVLFLAATSRLSPVAAAIGLTTVVLALATLAEGVVYLLRVVFPAAGRVPRAGGEEDVEVGECDRREEADLELPGP